MRMYHVHSFRKNYARCILDMIYAVPFLLMKIVEGIHLMTAVKLNGWDFDTSVQKWPTQFSTAVQ